MLSQVRKCGFLIGIILLVSLAGSLSVAQSSPVGPVPYLKLSTPRRVLPDAQKWEKNEFPHTMSVLEMKRGGFRYWGWYGLNEGEGIGLARSRADQAVAAAEVLIQERQRLAFTDRVKPQ